MDFCVVFCVLAFCYIAVGQTLSEATFTSFEQVTNSSFDRDVIPVNVTKTQGVVQCCLLCIESKDCLSVAYRQTDGTCARTERVVMAKHLVPDQDWTVYKSLTSVDGCFQGSCYKLLQEKMTWFDAKRECIRTGGHLADITSADEHAYISKGFSGAVGENMLLFIGANDLNQDGVFRWGDGSLLARTFASWLEQQPNNGQPTNRTEDCVVMSSASNYKFNDFLCDFPCPSLCEYD